MLCGLSTLLVLLGPKDKRDGSLAAGAIPGLSDVIEELIASDKDKVN